MLGMEKGRPKSLLAASVVFFLLVSATAFYKENGLRDVKKLRSAIENIDGEIASVRGETDRIRLELASLNSDDKHVESIARESLGLVKPGETVYEFIDANELAEGAIR